MPAPTVVLEPREQVPTRTEELPQRRDGVDSSSGDAGETAPESMRAQLVRATGHPRGQSDPARRHEGNPVHLGEIDPANAARPEHGARLGEVPGDARGPRQVVRGAERQHAERARKRRAGRPQNVLHGTVTPDGHHDEPGPFLLQRGPARDARDDGESVPPELPIESGAERRRVHASGGTVHDEEQSHTGNSSYAGCRPQSVRRQYSSIGVTKSAGSDAVSAPR